MKLSTFLLLTFLSLFAVSHTIAQAVKGTNVKKVIYTTNGQEAGSFVETAPKKWTEYKVNSSATHATFSELRRDEWSVYLQKSDGLQVQLDLWTKEVKIHNRAYYQIGATSAASSSAPSSSGAVVTVYGDAYFKGASQSFGVGDHNMNSLNVVGNDRISSIKVPSGYQVVAYQHDNFQGSSRTYKSDVGFTSDFNDQISSLKVSRASSQPNPPSQPSVQVVDNSNRPFPYYEEDKQAGDNFTKNDNPQSWIYTASKDWMSYLPDDTKLKNISIPGTHDSGARFLGLAYEAQSWTITEQLDAGIRYLDIRCRPTGTSFAIHHGNGFQKAMFGDVMNEAVRFLNAHPKETIVMRMKADEHDPQAGSESASQIWNRYRETYKNHLFQGHSTDPTLGQARGKVFVMLNYCWNCTYNGMTYNESGQCQIQDFYKVYWFAHKETKGGDWATLPSKKDKIKEYINLAQSSSQWVLNHLSGAVGMTPPDVARATNGETYDYLASRSGKRKLGILIMDFPGEKLIYRIIKSNFDFGSSCNCPPKTFRSVSDHSWVEFRLPQGAGGKRIDIPSGAYNHYVFPKCNRVHWSDLVFSCNPNSCQWERASGSWDADALCHGSKGNSPYVVTGDR